MAQGFRILVVAVLFIMCLLPAVSGQQKVDPRNTHHRLLCIVPMIGSGNSIDNPKRPLFAPLPGQVDHQHRTGILAFSYVLSDDGNFALMELVFDDDSVLDNIRGDHRLLKMFEKGRDRLEDIVAEFRKHKKDFDFDHFGVRMP